MYCLNTKCAPGHHPYYFMTTGALGHIQASTVSLRRNSRI